MRKLYKNATLALLPDGGGYGLLENGVLLIEGGSIAYAGPVEEAPVVAHDVEIEDLAGRLVTPGLVDCHTHLIYGGSRANEFEMRLNGATYEEIARAGGGIFSTVKATREASDEVLLDGALQRVDRLIADGVTTVEIKSGYGLDVDTELRLLRLANRIATERPIRVMKTFLGAHAVPGNQSADDYLDQVCIPALRMASKEGLVDAVDGFCENIAFSPTQIERLFRAASELGLPVKLHAEQLSNQYGAALAARYGALSADHLEYIDEVGVQAMADAGTIAVMLPGAFYYLKEDKLPPIESFRRAGVSMAVATDSNPGSAPMSSLLLAMNMAAVQFGMTPEECLRGVTVYAAKALGLKRTGKLKAGFAADVAIWDVFHPAELTYRIGDAALYKRLFGGLEC